MRMPAQVVGLLQEHQLRAALHRPQPEGLVAPSHTHPLSDQWSSLSLCIASVMPQYVRVLWEGE